MKYTKFTHFVLLLSKIFCGNEKRRRQYTLQDCDQIEIYPDNWWLDNRGATVELNL